jgi:phosphotransferase system enzyme I (PtsI)
MAICEETLINGMGLVPGIGWGNPFYIQPEWFQEKNSEGLFESIDKEILRFEGSLKSITDHLKRLQMDFERERLLEEAEIVAAQLALLQEGTLVHEILNKIKTSLFTVEKAVSFVKQKIKSRFSRNLIQTNRTFELLEDIFLRILSEARVCRRPSGSSFILSQKSVLVTESLVPSRATELLQQGFVAIVTKRGGLMSHAALLARSKGIPFVTNILQKDWDEVLNAKTILVDGFRGGVCVNPSKELLLSYQRKRENILRKPSSKSNNSDFVQTKDGVSMRVFASIEYSASLEKGEIEASDGVGLYRSEYLVQELGYLPHEETQLTAFQHLIDIAGHKPVTIRVFDFSGDKQWVSFDKSTAPFQGHLRSLSELMASPSLFFPHIRAIVRSAFVGKVSILFPMISSLQDFRKCRKIVDAARLSLGREHDVFPDVAIGVMVELPSIICQLPELLEEVDFIALGTNDLVQYCLAISRLGEVSCDRSSYLHEGFLSLLRYISESCRKAKKTCVVCGELVSDPGMRLLLLGLGFTSFTLPLGLVSEAKKAFSCMNFEEARGVVDMLFSLSSAKERFKYLEEWKEKL